MSTIVTNLSSTIELLRLKDKTIIVGLTQEYLFITLATLDIRKYEANEELSLHLQFHKSYNNSNHNTRL
jgi:hypothetical protein